MPIASPGVHQKRETLGELQFLTLAMPFKNLQGRDVRLIYHPKSRQQEADNEFTKTDSPISGID